MKLIVGRKLKIPIIRKIHIMYLLLGLMFTIIFIVWICSTIKLNNLDKLLISFVFFVFFIEVYLRFVLIFAIKIYQRYTKEDIRRRCICLPSCSEYSIICLRKIFPLAFALLKIKKRLFNTCKGEKYILDYPIKKDEEMFFSNHIKQSKILIREECEPDSSY